MIALVRRVLWAEALYDAFPNRFTLWLWKRAADKFKAERDRTIVRAGKVKWPGEVFVDSLTGPAHKARPPQPEPLRFMPGRYHRVDAAQAIQHQLAQLQSHGLQNVYNSTQYQQYMASSDLYRSLLQGVM